MSVLKSIQQNWPEVELGEVCEFSYGKSLPAKSRSGAGFPVYGSNGLVGYHDHALTDGETIIIGRKGSFGEVHYSAGPCSPIDTTYYITEKQTEAYLPWLARRLHCIGLDQLNRAAAIPGLNRTDAYRQKLLLPPFAEQKRIAAILDAADALRAKRRESLDQLDTLLQSTFLDMFGDHRTGVKESLSCKLGGQITLQRGKDITKKAATPGPVPVISSGGVSFYHNEPLISGPGVLLGRKGSVGKVHYASVDYWPHDTTLYVKDFKGNEPLFVYYFFKQFPISDYEASAANPSLNRNNLHPVDVFWPPLDLQRRFATIFDSVEQQKARLREHLAELDTLFASLQQRAFNGDL